MSSALCPTRSRAGLQAELAALYEAIERSGLDVSRCMECGQAVVCIPDGTPLCEPCGLAASE